MGIARRGLPWGPTGFSTDSKEREDEYGEEGEKEGEQEEGRSGAQEEKNDESVGEKNGEEGDQEGGAEAQGAGEESTRSNAHAGTCSLLAASHWLGNGQRRRQLTPLRAL